MRLTVTESPVMGRALTWRPWFLSARSTTPEFAGVVTRKMWTDIRVRDEVCNDMTKDIDEIVRLIDQEMEMMS